MAKKDEISIASPFDAHLEPNENILWIEHQEWLNDRRLTQGHKVSWGVILILFLVLSFGITILFGFEALLLIYGLAGVQILFAYLHGSFPYWVLGGFPRNKSKNPTYFQCWYAVTNRRLLYAFKDRMDSMTLLETVNISKVVERNRRGRLNFGRPGKVLRFTDIPDADTVYELILEQQRFLQKMEQSQP
jgi:hypothetical protein